MQSVQWTVNQSESSKAYALVTRYMAEPNPNGLRLDYQLVPEGGPGLVQCEISYSAAGGKYQGTTSVQFEVIETPPGLPSGATYTGGETSRTIHVGEEVTLDKEDIEFTNDGAIPQDADVWREIWNGDGDWGSVQESWNEERTRRTLKFNNPGQYTVNMVIAIGNYERSAPVTIEVLAN